MKFSKDQLNKARADYCVSQAALAKDDKIKQFWDDLANEWLEISCQRKRHASRQGLASAGQMF